MRISVVSLFYDSLSIIENWVSLNSKELPISWLELRGFFLKRSSINFGSLALTAAIVGFSRLAEDERIRSDRPFFIAIDC